MCGRELESQGTGMQMKGNHRSVLACIVLVFVEVWMLDSKC